MDSICMYIYIYICFVGLGGGVGVCIFYWDKVRNYSARSLWALGRLPTFGIMLKLPELNQLDRIHMHVIVHVTCVFGCVADLTCIVAACISIWMLVWTYMKCNWLNLAWCLIMRLDRWWERLRFTGLPPIVITSIWYELNTSQELLGYIDIYIYTQDDATPI